MESLSDYQLGAVTDWSSLALLRVCAGGDGTPLGYIFVIDRKKFGERAQYKMPGGHKKPGETPLETAMREVEGETGIALPAQSFRYHGKYLGWKKDHWKCLFSANLSEADRDWMNGGHAENEGERPEFLDIEAFYRAVRDGRMLREHYEKLVEYALLPSLGRNREFAAAS